MLVFNCYFTVYFISIGKYDIQMKDRIFDNKITTIEEIMKFADIFALQLNYKIALHSNRYVDKYPIIFEQGSCEYSSNLDHLLDHWISGTDAAATIGRDYFFLSIFKNCCDCAVLRDRNHITVMRCGAIVCIVEAWSPHAETDLIFDSINDKYNKNAALSFPQYQKSIFSFATFTDLIVLYQLTYSSTNQNFERSELQQFDMKLLDERVAFVQCLLKICQFIVGVKCPNKPFHLAPGHKTKTTNGHNVTW